MNKPGLLVLCFFDSLHHFSLKGKRGFFSLKKTIIIITKRERNEFRARETRKEILSKKWGNILMFIRPLSGGELILRCFFYIPIYFLLCLKDPFTIFFILTSNLYGIFKACNF
jgi:hypothetical protein